MGLINKIRVHGGNPTNITFPSHMLILLLQLSNFSFGKDLSHPIYTILICMNLFKLQQFRIQNIMNPMIPNINVLLLGLKNEILAKKNGTLTVTRQHKFLLLQTKLL